MTPTMQPTKIVGPLIGEFAQEAATTRRVLERVPSDKLGWKPHAKSMTLGQLAMHIATVPGGISRVVGTADSFEINPAAFVPPNPQNTDEVLAAFDASTNAAQEYLASVSDSAAMTQWRATVNGKEIMAMPRIAALRALMLNHWYHHRGQLSVYLRLLDVPVPSIYGPSADENPFG